MTKYEFTFGVNEEAKFRRVMERLDPEEYTVIKEIYPVDLENIKTCERKTEMEMEPEAALTFRLGMKEVKIRRDRTEEELAEEKRINDQHTVHVHVKVDGMNADGTFVDPNAVGTLADPNFVIKKLEGIQLK